MYVTGTHVFHNLSVLARAHNLVDVIVGYILFVIVDYILFTNPFVLKHNWEFSPQNHLILKNYHSSGRKPWHNALTFPGAVGCVKLWCCVWCCEGAELKGFRSITPVVLSDQLSSSVLTSWSRTLGECNGSKVYISYRREWQHTLPCLPTLEVVLQNI